MQTIGIRREDKNRWERRAPLTPDHVAALRSQHGLRFRVQPCAQRAFPDQDYAAAGAEVEEDLSPCAVILAVKEIPPERILPGKTYLFFSHVIKGQAANMPMLRRLLDQRSTLIDYEPIVDRSGRRLIFFGRHAGYAGMIDTLWALGQRLEAEGLYTPLAEIRTAHQYSDLDEATDHVSRIGERIRHEGLPPGLRPVTFAFTGSGNVSQGAQEVFDRLPFLDVDPDDLAGLGADRDRPQNVLFKTVLGRGQRVERSTGGGFDADEFAAHPERYQSTLGRHLPHVTVLVNGIYWEPSQPRLVPEAMLRALWSAEAQPKLRVIGDITCDVDGSIAANVRATDSGDPVYVYDPETGTATAGVAGRGVVVMAVDNLPCELPREASQHFGDSLARFVPALARCDWSRAAADLALPAPLRGAVIAHGGELTPTFRHLSAALESA